ncbi:MAG: N-acetylmuramic acid 6-phosphate etherase [Gemmataceae bacterium]
MLLDHLLTEARNSASMNLDEMTPLEIVHLMNREDGRAIEAVGAQAEQVARAIELIANRLAAGGRLVYAGAGTSGRLGILDATECPPTFNSPPGQVVGVIAGGPPAVTSAVEGAEDHPEFACQDLAALNLGANDVVVGIATSGRTPYVVGAMEYAKSVGAATIGLACTAESELGPKSDLMITALVGPEVLCGSTRLKAGTATKLILNMLTTGAMVRLGKCFSNLMVDLRATNQKLKARTNRIVRLLTGLESEAADELLARCGGELKTALLVETAKLSPVDARTRLAECAGRVGDVLKAASLNATGRIAADLVIGIDGGGSSTTALVADASGIIGRGRAGPSNLQAVGVTRAMRALEDAIAAAFSNANRPLAKASAAVFGLAGADRLQEQQLVRAWALRANIAAKVDVVNDAALLLAAGTPDGWGVALVAGTGSIAFAKSPDGATGRAGGWGYLLGDEGSGYAIVMDALKAVAQAADGRGPKTKLTERLLPAFNVAKPMDLIPAIYRGSWDRTALSALAPLVLEAAESHDETAEYIAAAHARELAIAVRTVAESLDLNLDALPVALTGGTLLGSQYYRTWVLDALARRAITVNPVTLVHEPAEGGVRLARSLATA